METGRFEVRNGSVFRTDPEYGTSESTDDTDVLSAFAALEKAFQHVADQSVRNDHAARATALLPFHARHPGHGAGPAVFLRSAHSHIPKQLL